MIPQGRVCVCACARVRPCLEAKKHQQVSFPFAPLRDNSVGVILLRFCDIGYSSPQHNGAQ